MSGAYTRNVLARFRKINWEKRGRFCINFLRQVTCVGEGGELERALEVRSNCFGKELPPLSNFIQTKKKKIC